MFRLRNSRNIKIPMAKAKRQIAYWIPLKLYKPRSRNQSYAYPWHAEKIQSYAYEMGAVSPPETYVGMRYLYFRLPWPSFAYRFVYRSIYKQNWAKAWENIGTSGPFPQAHSRFGGRSYAVS